jgi:PEP-CTERM motif-containing protein
MNLASRAAIFFATVMALPAAADATITVNIDQVGSDVVATMSGSLDLTGLSDAGPFTLDPSEIYALYAYVSTGAQGSPVEGYSGLTGPSNFGSDAFFVPSSTAGDAFVLDGSFFGIPYVFLPSGYASGDPLSGTSSWSDETLASLGLAPGQYIWGDARLDSVVVNIGPVPGVPEPATWVMMLVGFGLVGWRMRRKRRANAVLRPA